MMWLCPRCGASVGCHNNSRIPMGTMANAELRQNRQRAHAYIDPLWKSGYMSRTEVYQMLEEHFGCPVHVGSSDMDQCDAIISFMEEVKKEIENERNYPT